MVTTRLVSQGLRQGLGVLLFCAPAVRTDERVIIDNTKMSPGEQAESFN